MGLPKCLGGPFVVSEHTGAALTEHHPQPVRAGAMRGEPSFARGLTTPATACFHRGTSVGEKWRKHVTLSKFILNWHRFRAGSSCCAMIVHAGWRIKRPQPWVAVRDGGRAQMSRAMPVQSGCLIRITWPQWRAVWRHRMPISAFQGGGVAHATTARPPSVRRRWRLRTSASGGLFS